MRTMAELVDLVLMRERQAEAIEPEPVELESEPEPPVTPETDMERWQRLALESEQRGESVTMNSLLRSIPRPKLPRKPQAGDR